MKSRSILATGLLGLLFGSALSGVHAAPYSPGKHNQRRRPVRRPVKYATAKPGMHRDGCKAARKGIPGVPRGIETGIGVNGIRGDKGGGRDRGEATMTLCKRKQRAMRWGR